MNFSRFSASKAVLPIFALVVAEPGLAEPNSLSEQTEKFMSLSHLARNSGVVADDLRDDGSGKEAKMTTYFVSELVWFGVSGVGQSCQVEARRRDSTVILRNGRPFTVRSSTLSTAKAPCASMGRVSIDSQISNERTGERTYQLVISCLANACLDFAETWQDQFGGIRQDKSLKTSFSIPAADAVSAGVLESQLRKFLEFGQDS